MDDIFRDNAPWVIAAVVLLFVVGAGLTASRWRAAPPKRKRRTKYRLVEPDVAYQDAAAQAARERIMRAHGASDAVLVYVEGYPPLEGETAGAYRARISKEFGVKIGFVSLDLVPRYEPR